MKKYLLIVSCSKKKSKDLKYKKMKAIEAYSGPMFQVLKKAKREGRWNPNLLVGIVSAKYGFLREDDIIEDYELKMNTQLAQKHRSEVILKIKQWNQEKNFDLIYILMGKVYLKTINGIKDNFDTTVRIDNMGGLGLGQQKLLQFLNDITEV